MSGAPRPSPTWPHVLGTLVDRQHLSRDQAAWAMDQIMSGQTTPAVLGGFLVALRSKGETVEELTGLADAMLTHAVPIEVEGPSVDVVGTGGDRHRSVNISTMAALVVAGTGLVVVKHGNRAASSASGSADVLEALGVRLDLDVAQVAAAARSVGITFCFAQVFHPSMRFAGPTRKELGIPTTFNVLGPLTNPARPRAAAIGVADLRMAPLMAGVLARRGTSALLFRSLDGLDELSTTAAADLWEVTSGRVLEHRIDPCAAFGLSPATLDDLRGSGAADNAAIARRMLAGEHGPIRDAVLLNAAAALVADASLPGTAEGALIERLRVGLRIATRALDNGAAAAVLERWVAAGH